MILVWREQLRAITRLVMRRECMAGRGGGGGKVIGNGVKDLGSLGVVCGMVLAGAELTQGEGKT